MELSILEPKSTWYDDGLNFTCTQCGNCCTGGPGYVWMSTEEVARVAAFLEVTPEDVVEKYCRKFDSVLCLRERRTPEGNYDCIFLKEIEAKPADGGVPLKRRTCAIYPVRPLQCRTWPFWPENLSAPEAWDRAGKRCPGMGRGHRHFTKEQIDALRDARDWPENPPTSSPAPAAP